MHCSIWIYCAFTHKEYLKQRFLNKMQDSVELLQAEDTINNEALQLQGLSHQPQEPHGGNTGFKQSAPVILCLYAIFLVMKGL